MDVGDSEERLAVVLARLNQGPNVDIARGDDSVERRHDVRERLESFQPVDVRGGRIDLGGLRTLVAVLFVRRLLRHRRRCAQ